MRHYRRKLTYTLVLYNRASKQKDKSNWNEKQGIQWYSTRSLLPVVCVKWHTVSINASHACTNTKKVERQGLIIGRRFSRLKQLPGFFVGNKGLKIKASCVWQFRATYLFHFKSSTAFLGCYSELCFQYCALLKCNFLWPMCNFVNSHEGNIYLIFRLSKRRGIKLMCCCWK